MLFSYLYPSMLSIVMPCLIRLILSRAGTRQSSGGGLKFNLFPLWTSTTTTSCLNFQVLLLVLLLMSQQPYSTYLLYSTYSTYSQDRHEQTDKRKTGNTRRNGKLFKSIYWLKVMVFKCKEDCLFFQPRYTCYKCDRCTYCGKKLPWDKKPNSIHADHVQAWSKWGRTVVPTCPNCNLSKRDLGFKQWLRWLHGNRFRKYNKIVNYNKRKRNKIAQKIGEVRDSYKMK
jgi:hypothetical protein